MAGQARDIRRNARCDRFGFRRGWRSRRRSSTVRDWWTRRRTISHAKLLAQVWGAQYKDGGATLRIYVRRLRSKLGDDSLITSTRSIGYRFQPAVTVASPAA